MIQSPGLREAGHEKKKKNKKEMFFGRRVEFTYASDWLTHTHTPTQAPHHAHTYARLASCLSGLRGDEARDRGQGEGGCVSERVSHAPTISLALANSILCMCVCMCGCE